ncbi:MAG: antibiotic acetyltransferase [Chitinivibrionales bacterium]|nr:antibiotic acetyltransferase [Chitinivibrionales bacterium]
MVTNVLFTLYKPCNNRTRDLIITLVKKLEGGDAFSGTLRKIFYHYHKVDVGLYSLGSCFHRGCFHPHTKIGRYCSLARGIRALNRDHPLTFASTHPFFFNPRLGFCTEDNVEYIPLEIQNDVWIGHSAIIMANVRKIGNGAVIAAGAIVSKDIPPYAIVVGNPARVVRYRFTPEKIESLLASKWWEHPIEQLAGHVEEYQRAEVVGANESESAGKHPEIRLVSTGMAVEHERPAGLTGSRSR